MADKCHAGDGVRTGNFELYFFPYRHGIGIFHPFGYQHATGTTHAKSMAVEYFVEPGTNAINAQVGVDLMRTVAGTLAEVCPVRNFNDFIFFDEGDFVSC
jgi:hypothetical protein